MTPSIFRSGTSWKCYVFRGAEQCDLGVFNTKFEALQACASFEQQTLDDAGPKEQSCSSLEGHTEKSAHSDLTSIDKCAKGVYPSGSKWVAQCYKNLEWHYLGRYETKELADAAIMNFDMNSKNFGVKSSRLNSQSAQNQSSNDKLRMAELKEPKKSLKLSKVSAPAQRPPGVYVHHDKFAAQLYLNGKRCYLGVYKTMEEASAAVEAARRSAIPVGVSPDSHDDNRKEEDEHVSANDDVPYKTEPDQVNAIAEAPNHEDDSQVTPKETGKEQWMARVHRAGLWRQIGIFDSKPTAFDAVATFKQFEEEETPTDRDTDGVYRYGRRWRAIAVCNESTARVKLEAAFDCGLWETKAQAVAAIDLFRCRVKVALTGHVVLTPSLVDSLRSDTTVTGFKGISPKLHRWQARTHLNGKETYIGVFDTVDECLIAILRAQDDLEIFDGSLFEKFESIAAEVSREAYISAEPGDFSKLVCKVKGLWEVRPKSKGELIGTYSDLRKAVDVLAAYLHKRRRVEPPTSAEVIEIHKLNTQQARTAASSSSVMTGENSGAPVVRKRKRRVMQSADEAEEEAEVKLSAEVEAEYEHEDARIPPRPWPGTVSITDLGPNRGFKAQLFLEGADSYVGLYSTHYLARKAATIFVKMKYSLDVEKPWPKRVAHGFVAPTQDPTWDRGRISSNVSRAKEPNF